ncbi:regulator [Lampropedia cohaerens]|uniref:Regulator n=1 Tax=Lampropedia cohaerens TaxID=1610491 RepID=A0A0U1Q3L8_9BURK|nr:metal/formaldehyde-sensitive transcriptional repressor [Lampropedia cohaerens]KKW69349.1 regulator [Lampropedia cohaerens]
MPYIAEDKRRVVTRLRRIRGQAEALERAVEAGTECAQLLQQLAALRGAATSLMTEVLDMHLRETFVTPPAQTTPPDAQALNHAVDEVMRIVRAYVR